MPETQEYLFDCKAITEILIKAQGIHAGLWGISIGFGFGAATIQEEASEDAMLPAAIVGVKTIGIERVETPNAATVDAAKVNPVQTQKRRKTHKTVQ